MEQTLVERLRLRAEIRRQIPSRKSVQEGKPDRLADLLDEAANRIEVLEAQEPVVEIIIHDEGERMGANWTMLKAGYELPAGRYALYIHPAPAQQEKQK